jgi:hypothetical protein
MNICRLSICHLVNSHDTIQNYPSPIRHITREGKTS